MKTACLLFSGALAASLLLGGCSGPDSAPPTVLRNAARAVLVAPAYERALRAAKLGQDDKLLEELATLEDLGAGDLSGQLALHGAESLVGEALSLDTQATAATQQRASLLQQQAAEKYRRALRVSPNFASKNALLLNALGYFLAERGETQADFEKAETLTRKSLKILDQRIARQKKLPGGDAISLNDRLLRSAVRDSVAWALYRQGKFTDALKEQKQSLEEYVEIAGEENIGLIELRYHLGEIYLASGKAEQARQEFEKALAIDPEHELTLKAMERFEPGVSAGKQA